MRYPLCAIHFNFAFIAIGKVCFKLCSTSLTTTSPFLGGLSLHLNHLIAERMSTHYWQFGTLPIGIFLSNLVSGQLETSLMTSYCHF